MKNRFVAAACAAILALGVCGPAVWAKKKSDRAGGELAIGQTAPRAEAKMPDISGKTLNLQQAKGKKGLLVVFSCNTCPFVLAWEDRYQTIAEQCRRSGVGMILVNSNEAQREGADSMEEMRAHAKEKGYTVPYVVDTRSELADAFGATRTPHVFLFDSKLKLVYRGAIDDNSRSAAEVKEPYLSNAIDALAAGTAISVSSTKSIGCTIKRGG